MDPAAWIAAATAAATLITGTPYMAWQIRSKTADDRERTAERVARQIREARDEERERSQTKIEELIADRNAERARADGLQKLINEWGRK